VNGELRPLSGHLRPIDLQLALEGLLPASEASHLEGCQLCREQLAQEARLELQLLHPSSLDLAHERTEAAQLLDTTWDESSQIRQREAQRKVSHVVLHAALAVACSVLPWLSMASPDLSGVFTPAQTRSFASFQPWLR